MKDRSPWAWILIAAVALALGLAFFSRAGGDGSPADIDWQTSVPADTERPTLLYFTADWCPPCQAMKAETWPDDAVEAALRDFDAVYIDIDEQPALASQYDIEAIPTLVALAPDGTERARRTGFQSPTQLVSFLKP